MNPTQALAVMCRPEAPTHETLKTLQPRNLNPKQRETKPGTLNHKLLSLLSSDTQTQPNTES